MSDKQVRLSVSYLTVAIYEMEARRLTSPFSSATKTFLSRSKYLSRALQSLSLNPCSTCAPLLDFDFDLDRKGSTIDEYRFRKEAGVIKCAEGVKGGETERCDTKFWAASYHAHPYESNDQVSNILDIRPNSRKWTYLDQPKMDDSHPFQAFPDLFFIHRFRRGRARPEWIQFGEAPEEGGRDETGCEGGGLGDRVGRGEEGREGEVGRWGGG